MPVRVTVLQSMWLLIPAEYESRDMFCCHQPITCAMKHHGKLYNLSQSRFSNLWWPSTVGTHSLLVSSLCWLLSVSTKLSRLAAGIRALVFWVLWPLLPHDTWWHWVRVGESYMCIQVLALSCLSHLSFSLAEEGVQWISPLYKTKAGFTSCWIYFKYEQS